MKNRGFTLVEMLTVLAILSVIVTITFPIVIERINSSKEKAYKIQINEIKRATNAWLAKSENINSIPDIDGQSITLNLADLKIAGLLELDIINTKTNKSFPNNMLITVTRNMNQYDIEVLEDTGTDIEEENTIIRESPTIVLNGSYLMYVELNSTFIDPGARARSYNGIDLTSQITKEIRQNNVQKATLDTSSFGTYLIYYIVIDPNNGNRNTAIRTVIVRDTTPPIINLEEDTTITTSQAASYNLLTGVTATDNSNESITISSSGTISTTRGTYVITYTATDSSGNKATKKRIIRVQ